MRLVQKACRASLRASRLAFSSPRALKSYQGISEGSFISGASLRAKGTEPTRPSTESDRVNPEESCKRPLRPREVCEWEINKGVHPNIEKTEKNHKKTLKTKKIRKHKKQKKEVKISARI